MNGGWILGLASAAMGSAAAQADIIRFKFAGTIDEISGVGNPVQVGDDFTFAYNFNSATPDSDPAPNFGLYQGAIILAEGFVGPNVTIKLAAGTISVLNDGFAGDTYHAQAENPIMYANVGLTDFGFGAFSDDHLPTDLNFPVFDVVRFTVHRDIGPTFWEASGTITVFSREVISSCYPDCNGDGTLTIADFGCFQSAFVMGNTYADCNLDGVLTIADFGCFQSSFVAGCP